MELIERVAEAVCEAMYGKQFDAHQMPEAYGHADRIAKAAIRAMLDGVDVGALQALLALAPEITLRQAVNANVDEALGWDPYALKEGADPHSPAMASWKVEAARKSLDALKEAL